MWRGAGSYSRPPRSSTCVIGGAIRHGSETYVIYLLTSLIVAYAVAMATYRRRTA